MTKEQILDRIDQINIELQHTETILNNSKFDSLLSERHQLKIKLKQMNDNFDYSRLSKEKFYSPIRASIPIHLKGIIHTLIND